MKKFQLDADSQKLVDRIKAEGVTEDQAVSIYLNMIFSATAINHQQT